MLRVALAMALLTIAVSVPVAAPPPTPATPPAPSADVNLATARDALLIAQEQLRLADRGAKQEYGGHRKLALELVNTALQQVDAGLRLAAEESARKAQEVKKKPAPKRRR